MEEHPREPIAEFCGCLHGTKETFFEGVLGAEHKEYAQEHQGGEYLHLDFFPSDGGETLGRPKPFCLVCQETTDEEEEGHAEEHKEGEGGRYFFRLHESRLCHMICDDENHGEATHGIEPLKPFFLNFFHGVFE